MFKTELESTLSVLVVLVKRCSKMSQGLLVVVVLISQSLAVEVLPINSCSNIGQRPAVLKSCSIICQYQGLVVLIKSCSTICRNLA